MADNTTELEVLNQIVEVLGGQSGQYETVVPVLQQIKELLAAGITDPEAIAEAVAAWLDEHPEATTTVQDGSITGPKIADNTIPDAKLVQTGGVLSEVKDIALEIGNETTGTCTAANTFQNFPYTIRQGKTYVCTTLEVGNTMSFRTRFIEGSANIDSLNAVAYGAPKTFTATADANYIRVNSYLANGRFHIEEAGTVWHEIDQLKQEAPIVNLPSKLYAVVGRELNVYFDNIVQGSDRYTYNVTCGKGAQMQRGYSITTVADDVGTYDFQIDVYDGESIVATKQATLTIVGADAGSGTTATALIMGDSTVAGTDTQLFADFVGDSMQVATVGTRGTSPALHEGRAGWTFQYYYNSATIAETTNPFYNPTTHVFDAGYYFANSGVAAPDWFFIQLGINDVFSITDDDALATKLNQCKTQCDAMIASIKSASQSTKVGIALTIPPNSSQDAFGKAYGCGQTRDRYRLNNALLVQRLISIYDGRESDGIYVVPIYTNLDTTYNMGLESMPVNARNTSITYDSPIANGGVHPVESGYQQIADVYMAFLKANA